MAKLSVLMSCYNHEKFVAASIESVLNQSFEDFELLIIDDNSNDKSFEIIDSFVKQDQRIKAWRNTENKGMVINTNNLISKSSGEYIAFLNSDDTWEKTKIDKQLKFLEINEDFGACFTLCNMIDEKGENLNSKNLNPFEMKYYDRFQWLNHFFYRGNLLSYPSCVIKKSCLEQTGLFNPALACLLDLDMWIKICLAGYEIKILEENLTNFRVIRKCGTNLSDFSKSKSSRIRNHLEGEVILFNYLNTKDFTEFTKIFPDYHCHGTSTEVSHHLLMHCIEILNSKKKYPNKQIISNFALQALHQENIRNPNLIEILDKNFGYKYKNLLRSVALYPNGNLKVLQREIRTKNFQIFILILLILIIILWTSLA